MKYFADPKMPNKHSAIIRNEVMLSDDGRVWRRPFRGTDIGFFCFADPFVDSGRLCFASWKDNAIVLFKYRPNRLLGVTAAAEGSFMTAPLTIRRPVPDADASKGWVEVELLDAAGEPVRNVNRVRFEGKNDEGLELPFGVVGEEPYRLRVRLQEATVFAVGGN